MVQAPPTQKLTEFQEDILRTVLYFDIFSFPLTFEELYRFLPSNSTTPDRIRDACGTNPLAALLRRSKTAVQLANRPDFASLRRDREARATRMVRTAKNVATAISFLPFVKGVLLSGELSKGVASEKSDLDFVVITSPHRVWIVRAMLTLIKRTILFGSKRYLCLNYIVSAEHLQSEDTSLFSAIEILTLKPLAGNGILDTFLQANAWIKERFPNSSPAIGRSFTPLSSNPQNPEHGALSRLDRFLMRMWTKIWQKRYPELSDEERRRQFRCLPHLSTAFGVDQRQRILSLYRERLLQFGLEARR